MSMVRQHENGVLLLIPLVVDLFDYAFAENGLTAYRESKQMSSESFISWIGEEQYKKLAKFILHYIADLDIPVQRYVSCTVTRRDTNQAEELSLNSEMV